MQHNYNQLQPIKPNTGNKSQTSTTNYNQLSTTTNNCRTTNQKTDHSNTTTGYINPANKHSINLTPVRCSNKHNSNLTLVRCSNLQKRIKTGKTQCMRPIFRKLQQAQIEKPKIKTFMKTNETRRLENGRRKPKLKPPGCMQTKEGRQGYEPEDLLLIVVDPKSTDLNIQTRQRYGPENMLLNDDIGIPDAEVLCRSPINKWKQERPVGNDLEPGPPLEEHATEE